MSRIFIDNDLLSWEAYASGGRHGLPEEPKIVFHCLSDPMRRARYVRYGEDNAAAEQALNAMPEPQLQQMLQTAEELD